MRPAGNEAACLPSGAPLTCDTAASEAAKSGSKVNLVLMFISTPTNAHRSSIKLILKLVRHVAVFLLQPQGAYKFFQLKL
jgi:hypothetical protein